jgi:hypothetical protein
MKDFKKILKRTDVGLIQFFVYVGILVYLLFKGYGWWSVVFVHLFFVLIYGIIYFRYEFVMFIVSPVTAIIVPIQNYLVKNYLKNFKQNVPTKVVVVLGQSDWFQLEAWIKPNFFKGEIKSLVKYLKAKGQDFSFYTNASLNDVEKIMANKNIKEVYFFGHGTSHVFQLNTDDILYYCEFNNPEKYGKEFIHQVHCGTRDGKSLIDYVVPEKNRNKCFLFRKTINSYEIKKEFKKRTKEVAKN